MGGGAGDSPGAAATGNRRCRHCTGHARKEGRTRPRSTVGKKGHLKKSILKSLS